MFLKLTFILRSPFCFGLFFAVLEVVIKKKLKNFFNLTLFISLSVILQLSKSLTAHASTQLSAHCIDFYVKSNASLYYDKSTFIGNQLDKDKLNLWAEAQPPYVIETARIVAKNLKLISISEFEKQLKANFQIYLQQVGNPSKIVVVTDNGKSNKWVSDYLMRAFQIVELA